MKIALIQGGLSQEADVSRNTGKAFEQSLKNLGKEYVVVDAAEDLLERLISLKPDVALLALHGKYGEDGTAQGICEYLKIPYSGSGVLASALAMDKLMAKQVLAFNNIPTPKFEVFRKTSSVLSDFESRVDFPCVVKPAREGSSVGISILKDRSDFKAAIELALKSDATVLIEDFVEGVEVTVPILYGKALTPIQIEPVEGFYDYTNKYTSGKTSYYLPPKLNAETINDIKKLAEKSFELLGLHHYGRIDFMVDAKSQALFIEANTLPGCTETSLLPQSAKHDGISFDEVVSSLVETARLDYEGVV